MECYSTACLFYGLMYVHIMFINIPYARLGLGTYIANVVIYSMSLRICSYENSKGCISKGSKSGKMIMVRTRETVHDRYWLYVW